MVLSPQMPFADRPFNQEEQRAMIPQQEPVGEVRSCAWEIACILASPCNTVGCLGRKASPSPVYDRCARSSLF